MGSLLALVLTAACASSSPTPAADPGPSTSQAQARRPGDGGRLRIERVKPVDVTPGSAIVLQYSGGRDDEPLRVSVDKQPAEIVKAAPGRLVVRVPADADIGRAKLRLHQGELRSKSRDLVVESLQVGKAVREILGGLALFLFGLRTLARGLRGWAGQPTRLAVSAWTDRVLLGVGVGALLGAMTQAVTSAAGLLAGLVESRLIRRRPALVALLGAHFGAGVVVLLLPLGLGRDSLWIVVAGVIWLSLARNRRQSAGGKVLLGLGLLFYGLAVLRGGFGPLVTDPAVLDRVDALGAGGALGLTARTGTGILLGALLQGPGAVFGLVLGVSESTGLLAVRQALEILAGANVGAALTSLLLTAPFGRRVRRVAVAHLALSAVMMLVFVVLAPLAVQLVAAVMGGDPSAAVFGKKILFPEFGPHFGAAFALVQATSVAVAAALVAPLDSLLARRRQHEPEVLAGHSGDESTKALLDGLHATRTTLDAILALLTTGERARAVVGEAEFGRVRASIKDTIERLQGEGSAPSAVTMRGTASALLHVQADLEQLQRISERGIEKDLSTGPDVHAAFRGLDERVRVGLDHAVAHLEGRSTIEPEAVQIAEIQLNADEAQLRARWLATLPERPGAERAVLWSLEVLAAYESVGNQVYRLATSLAADDLE